MIPSPADLAALAALDALLQTASVTRAARRLGLSTPAVSHALARLRIRFDDPLLVRAGRGMVLTPRAEALKPQVRAAVAAGARVFEDPEAFDPSTVRRSFAISASDYVLVVFGPAFEERVRAAAPGVDLRYLSNAVDDGERLRRGESDLAVGIYGALGLELRIRTIITDRFVCVVRADHPTVGEVVDLDTFIALEHIQVAPRGRPGGYVDGLLAQRGLARRVSRAVPYFQVALAMTAASDAVLTVSERIARAQAPALGLRVVEPPLPLEPFALSMVWHPRFDADPAHGWLRAQLVAATAALDGRAHPDARRRLDPGDPTGFPGE